MNPPIPLISQMAAAERDDWLRALASAMPGERIIPLEQVTDDERHAVDVAIVANPDPRELDRLPALGWVHSLWAGVERLVADLGERDLAIVRLVDPQLARTMAEAVLAWTLYLHRDMPAYAAQQRRHHWRALPYRRPEQRTVGLLGLGALGEVAAANLVQAGFKVCGWSRTPKSLPNVATYWGQHGLEALAAETDILVCLLPLTAQTRGLVDRTLLAHLPSGAALINFGRGPVVDMHALLQALENRHIEHAVLDVFDEEPLPPQSPLWDHPHITVLPHVSAPTDLETASAIVARNIGAFRSHGTIPPAVDIRRGY